MKVALLQQATRTTTGTQNWTDSSVTSDLKAAIFFNTDATANASVTAAFKGNIGCTDLTNNVAFGMGAVDATAASSGITGQVVSNTNCLLRVASTGLATLAAAYSATLSNGVTINYGTVDGAAYLVNCLLISGSDVEVKTSNAQFATTDTTKTITHNLTGTPDLVIVVASVGQTAMGVNFAALNPILGFYDGTNSVGLGFDNAPSTSPTSVDARITADLGHNVFGASDNFTLLLSSVGSSTFTLSRTATNSEGMSVMCIAIRHTANTAAALAFNTTLPTSTGNAALVTGMAVKPQLLFSIPTRLTTNSLTNTDAAGAFGFGVACNDSGTTQQMSIAATSEDVVTTTVSKSQISITQALMVLNDSGTIVNEATVNSWDSGGVTLNHSVVSGTAYEMIGLAYGIATNVPITPNAGSLALAANAPFFPVGTVITPFTA